MIHSSTNAPSCKDSPTFASPASELPYVNSHVPQQITSNVLPRLAAIALVLASAGFGSLYAWGVGIEHGTTFASLAVLMALGLEIAKPLAVAFAFKSLASWQPGTGLAMLLLGTVAIAYSLTAELSLMATARGDRIAERESVASAAANGKAQRARIETELAALGTGRPSAAIAPELAALLIDKRLANCDTWLESVRLRAVCIEKAAPLRVELAKAQRREALTDELAALDEVAPGVEVKPDPAASALSVYLSALGIKVDSALLSEWLVLVPVFALEIGSAFAGVLAGSSAVSTRVQTRSKPAPATTQEHQQPSARPDVFTGVQTEPTKLAVPDDPGERLVQLLRERGGELLTGQRMLARALGVSTGAVNALLRELTDAGHLIVDASKRGTRVRLVAAA